MAMDMKKMRKDYQTRQKSGEFWQVPEGDTVLYIHPPCRSDDNFEPTDGLNYVPVVVHYQVGKNNAMVVNLDPETNPIVTHPFVKAQLKKAKKKLTGECPMSELLSSEGLDEDDADDMRAQTKYLWGVTPLKYRRQKSDEWSKMDPVPRPALFGKTIYDGIMELFFEHGDISEADGAILVQITKSGKGLKTKYKVTEDKQTLRKPMKLPSAMIKKLAEAMKEGGDCDLFRVVANMIKAPSEVEALIAGVRLDEEDDDDDIDDEDSDDSDDDDDSDDSEDEEDDADDDEEDDDADEDSEDEEDDDADDDSEDEEDDADDDEDEEPPQPKKKKKTKGKAKPADDIESELDKLDKELDKVAKKKTKKRTKK